MTNWEKSILKLTDILWGFFAEQLGENEKQLRKTTRDVERDRRGLEREEQKVMAEIKKAAKANNKQGQPVDYYRVFFFGVYEKTQGDKNSNSRKMDQKLKDLFPENSRNRKFSGKL